jgi:hypothetical protein
MAAANNIEIQVGIVDELLILDHVRRRDAVDRRQFISGRETGCGRG